MKYLKLTFFRYVIWSNKACFICNFIWKILFVNHRLYLTRMGKQEVLKTKVTRSMWIKDMTLYFTRLTYFQRNRVRYEAVKVVFSIFPIWCLLRLTRVKWNYGSFIRKYVNYISVCFSFKAFPVASIYFDRMYVFCYKWCFSF